MEVELHPYNPQHSLKNYCEARGILLEAYSPLGSTSEHLQKVQAHKKTPHCFMTLSFRRSQRSMARPSAQS
jgi:diketogulonate reductase-like aldo/keto reductase